MAEKAEKKLTFGRIFWPSLVAILIASIISMVIFFMILGGLIGGIAETKPYIVEDKTVLHMTLEGKINQRTYYRYLIAGKFLIFYKTDEKVVSIYRVLSSEMDYIKLLFK